MGKSTKKKERRVQHPTPENAGMARDVGDDRRKYSRIGKGHRNFGSLTALERKNGPNKGEEAICLEGKEKQDRESVGKCQETHNIHGGTEKWGGGDYHHAFTCSRRIH